MTLKKVFNIKLFFLLIIFIFSIYIYNIVHTGKYIHYVTIYIEKSLKPIFGHNNFFYGNISVEKNDELLSIKINDIKIEGNHKLFIPLFNITIKKGLFGFFYKLTDVSVNDLQLTLFVNDESIDDVNNAKNSKKENYNKPYSNALDHYISEIVNSSFNLLNKVFFNIRINNIYINDTYFDSLYLTTYGKKIKLKNNYLEGEIKKSDQLIKLTYNKDSDKKICISLNNFLLQNAIIENILNKYIPDLSNIFYQDLKLNTDIILYKDKYDAPSVEIDVKSIIGKLNSSICDLGQDICNIDYGALNAFIYKGSIQVKDFYLSTANHLIRANLVYSENDKYINFYSENTTLDKVISYWPNYLNASLKLKKIITNFIEYAKSDFIDGKFDFMTGELTLHLSFYDTKLKTIKEIIPKNLNNIRGDLVISKDSLTIDAYEDIQSPIYTVRFSILNLFSDDEILYELAISSEGKLDEYYTIFKQFTPFYSKKIYDITFPFIDSIKNIEGKLYSETIIQFDEKKILDYSINFNIDDAHGLILKDIVLDQASLKGSIDKENILFLLSFNNSDNDIAVFYQDDLSNKEFSVLIDGFIENDFIYKVLSISPFSKYHNFFKDNKGFYNIKINIDGDDLKNARYVGKLNLNDVNISYPEISFSKKKGDNAKLFFEIITKNNQIISSKIDYNSLLDDINIKIINNTNGLNIISDRVSLANNNFKFNIKNHDDYFDINIDGKRADIYGLIKLFSKIESNNDVTEDFDYRKYNLKIKLSEGLLYDDSVIRDLNLRFSLDKNDVFLNCKINSKNGEVTSLNAKYNNDDNILISGDNAGVIINALGISKYIDSGKLQLSIDLAKQRKIIGTVLINNFYLKSSPTLAQIFALTSFNLSNITSVITGKGIEFSYMYLDFSYSDFLFSIEESWAIGAALAIRNLGVINLVNGDHQIYGSVVPYYQLSKTISLIPIFGNILTDTQTKGLISSDYKIENIDGESKLTVDTMTIITPSLIRKFFDTFGELSLSYSNI